MNNWLKVKDHPGLYRDPISKAIVINDPAARKNYQTQRQVVNKSIGAVDELKDEINIIKDEINELKHMLKDIASYINKSNSQGN